MAFAYRDPRTGLQVTVEQAVRVAHSNDWRPAAGAGRGAPEAGCCGRPALGGRQASSIDSGRTRECPLDTRGPPH
jgi:hypothetical protein